MELTPEQIGPVVAGFLAAVAYTRGLMNIRRKEVWLRERRRLVAFVLGLIIAEWALLGPLGERGDQALLWHMLEHFTLLFIAVPLLAVSGATWVCSLALPRSLRAWVLEAIKSLKAARLPGLVGAWLFIPVLWGWHIPRLYATSVEEPVVHAVAHISMVVTAFCFWLAALGMTRPKVSTGVQLALVCTAAVVGALFSAILMFANQPLYGPLAPTLGDQATAAAVMCIPTSLVYLCCSVRLLTTALSSRVARVTNRMGPGAVNILRR